MKTNIYILPIAYLLIAGCIKAPESNYHVPQLAEQTENNFFIHRVRSKNEHLDDIAKWYTGDGKNAPQLTNSTPGLSDRKLKVGEMVFIPDALVIKREEMPATKKKAKLPAATQEPSAKVEEIHPNHGQTKEAAAVIGIYRFDQLPTPKGETPESLHRLFGQQSVSEADSNESILYRKQLETELLED